MLCAACLEAAAAFGTCCRELSMSASQVSRRVPAPALPCKQVLAARSMKGNSAMNYDHELHKNNCTVLSSSKAPGIQHQNPQLSYRSYYEAYTSSPQYIGFCGTCEYITKL